MSCLQTGPVVRCDVHDNKMAKEKKTRGGGGLKQETVDLGKGRKPIDDIKKQDDNRRK